MIQRLRILPIFLSALLPVCHAGTIANGSWSAAGCGARPEPYRLDLKNIDAYNKSVAGANTYRQNSRTYLDCVIREANGDIQSISKSAKDLQQATQDAEELLQADVKAADKKFGKQ